MLNDKMLTLLGKLFDLTRGGKISWEETEDEQTFQTALSDYAIRILKRDFVHGASKYVLSTYNSKGEFIEDITSTELSEKFSDGYERFEEFYELIRVKATGVDEELNNILSKLDDV